MAPQPPQPLWALAGALLAGLAQALSLAWPGSGAPQWGLQLASLAALAWLLQPAISWRRAAVLGWVFATAWLSGTFWWLFISMHTYGGLAAPLAVAGVLGLAAFLGSYYAVISGVFKALAPTHRALVAIIFAALWTLAELARGTWWTGFPWGASGYAHVDGPLAVLARSVGIYGVGFVAALLAMLLVQVRRSDLRNPRVGLLLLAGLALWAALTWQRHRAVDVPTTTPPLTLALLQGNIPQDEKFQSGSGVPLALQWYAQALLNAQAALVVAPETAIPLLPQQLLPGYLDAIEQHYRQGEGPSAQAALIGIPLGHKELGYTNSVLGFYPGQTAAYRYDKHHLVPFGEFIPPLFKWFTQMMNIPLGDFNRGTVAQLPLLWHGERIAPHICYEDLFSEELGARFASPAQAPTLFINLSNIAWFGDSVAIDQHLNIGRMRALEFERPMVRATNTGATAIIDHRGAVTHQLARHTRGILTGQVQGRGGPLTPYAYWVSRWGLWPLWIFCTLMVLIARIAPVVRRSARPHHRNAPFLPSVPR